MPFIEERERFLEVVDAFLTDTDDQQSRDSLRESFVGEAS
jgi:hypothetical protein